MVITVLWQSKKLSLLIFTSKKYRNVFVCQLDFDTLFFEGESPGEKKNVRKEEINHSESIEV